MELNRIIVFGSHKGLGFSIVKTILNLKSENLVLGLSRKDSGEFNSNPKYQFYSLDFTKVLDRDSEFQKLLDLIQEFKPTKLVYAAGGGPFGGFAAKNWKDHEWALKLNFLFPAKLVWSLKVGLESKIVLDKSLDDQTKDLDFLYVGSAIAESDQGDALGPSYAAAKWAMKGLYLSLLAETKMQEESSSSGQPRFHFKWISPGYMDTDLLPKGAWPRTHGTVKDPLDVAQEIIAQLGLVN